MLSLFTFLVYSVVSNELLFISLESDNLIYPMGLELQSGIDQENNIYFYDVTSLGINTGSDIFTIGLWIKGNSQSEKQFIMSIMSIDGVSEIVYLEYDQIMTIEGNSFEYIDEVWVYLFFLQLDLSSQWICYLDLSINYDLQCQQFRGEGEYYLFSFLQPSISQTEFYEIYPWQGEAISITAKLLNMQYDIFDNPIKSLIISNYVELNVIFDLKLYEKTQTKILKDWSNNQHIVKIGNAINPIIIPNQQLLSFQNQQYIEIENFKISNTITIEFQLFDDILTDEITLFIFQSKNLAIDVLTIKANFNTQALLINLNMIPIQVCSVNFGSKIIIAIINGILTTSILIIQNEEQVLLTKEVLSYEQAFQFQHVDTLTIGSKDNTNINSFRLSNIRISNGFYYVIKEQCAFSINQCYYCLNNYYLHQGQCLPECPSNFETNEFRKECIPQCHPTCLTCDPFNLSYCLTCSGIRIKEPNCSCPPGYFDDGISPDCIEYLPDLTVESGIFEGTCQSNIQQEIKFTKKYLFPPLVAISLLGHIAKEQYQNQGFIFTISAQDITNISFFLTVICMDPKVYIKVQWVSGYSSRFFNVNENLIGVFPVDVFDVSIQKENLVIGNILGWNIDKFDEQDINLNLEKKSDTNTFEITTNLSLVQIFYQLFEFTNYVYDQILISLDLCNQGKDFSIGGAHGNVNIKHVPLSIPSFTTLKQFHNQNSHILQFYLSENKRTGQMKYSLKTLGQQTTFPYLKGDIVIFAIKCNNHYKPCDYFEELQKCHKILSNCECSSSQYYNQVKNYCVDCSYNCQTCDIHYTNCLTCPSEYQQTLQQDQVTLYYYCGCKQNQFQDTNGICQDCDPMCLSCEQTKTKCKSCIEPKNLNELNQCICNPGYIATQFGCEQSVRDLCSFFKDDNQCEQCVPLSLFNPITKKCECNFGYYQEDQQCLACNEPCISCLSSTICLSCVATMYFDQFSCHKCQPPCYECNSEQSCISCINQTYILDGDQCLQRDYSIQQDCEEGFELLNNQCVSICGDSLVTNKEECDDGNNIQFDGCHLCQYSCPQNCTDCYQGNCQECENNFILLTNGQCESNQICGDGILMDPEFCDDANTIGGDGCNNCFIESNWKCNELNECTFFKAPQIILIYQNQTFNKQYISITFTQKVKVYSSFPLSQAFEFDILNISNKYYNYKLHIKQDTNQEIHLPEYILELEINQLLDYRPILRLLINQIVGNSEDLILQQNEYLLTLMFPQYLNKQQQQYSYTFLYTNKQIIYVLSALSIATVFFGVQYLFLECLNILQYQQYLRYINQDYPQNLLIYFQISDMITIQPFLEYIHFDDLFEFLDYNSDMQFKEGQFRLYPQNANLLSNLQTQFFQFIIGLLVWISVKQLKKILFYNIFNQRFLTFMTKLYPYINKQYVQKISLKLYKICLNIINLGKYISLKGLKQILLLNGWDIIFKIFIFTKIMNFNNSLDILQVIISFAILMCYFIVILSIFDKNSQQIQNLITQSLENMFEIAQVIRKMLFLFILIYFQDSGMLQIKLICITSLFQIALLFSYRKIFKLSAFIIQLVLELSVLIFTLSSSVYNADFMYLFNEQKKIIFGWCHILILSSGIIVELLNQAIQIIKSIIQKFKHVKQKEIERTKPRIMFIEV